MLSGNFFGSEIRHGIFLVLNFGTGIFGGLPEALGNCWNLIFVPIQSSLSLEIRRKIGPEKSPITIQVLLYIITDHYHVD